MSKILRAFALAAVAFLVGILISPFFYPYKMFIGADASEIARTQMGALSRSATFFGPHALQGYLGLIFIFGVAYRVGWLHGFSKTLVFYLLLGVYYGIMINGNEAAYAHASFDEMVRTMIPVLTQMPLYLLFPLILMLGIPLLIAFAFSWIRAPRTA